MYSLYIDPGTGSMLFTILIGVFGVGVYFLRTLIMKIKFIISGGKREKMDGNKLPIVIFSDNKRYWNIFEPICDEFEKRGQEVCYFTASPDDKALEKKYEHIKAEFIGEGNKAFSRLNLLNATVVLSTTPSLDVFQWKRSKEVQYYVHIPHAAGDITIYRMFGIDFYDSILLSGQFQIDQLKKLWEIRGVPVKEMELVGIPYMDEMKKRVDANRYVRPEGEVPTILLAPSWGPSSIFAFYGGRIIDELLKTGYKVVVRPHPQSFESEKEMMDELMSKYPDSDKLEWNRDTDNFDVLNRSDILISDFSGVLYDFSLVFDKPIIYADTSFDKSVYDAAWLEDDLWTFSILPSLGQQLSEDNIGNIKEVIDECLNDPKYQAGRDKARSETWVHMGEGAKRTVDYMMDKYNALVKEAREKAEKESAKVSKKPLRKKKEKAAKKPEKEAAK